MLQNLIVAIFLELEARMAAKAGLLGPRRERKSLREIPIHLGSTPLAKSGFLTWSTLCYALE